MTTISITNTNLAVQTLILSSGDYVVASINHESAPPAQVTSYVLARRETAKVINHEYRPKTILIEGYVKGTTKDLLEQNLDTLKKYLSGMGNKLTVSYAGATRIYTFELKSFVSSRKAGDVTLAPYSAELEVNDVFGKAASESSKTFSSLTAGSLDATFTSQGTHPPEPSYTLTLNSANGFNSIKIYGVDGRHIRVQDSKFTAGDVILVDTPNRRVLRTTITADNYQEIFTGLFPKTKVGQNNLQFNFSASNYNGDLEIAWIDRYL